MDSKDLRELMESYSAVYDEELRNELEYTSIDEDLSFIDDLSDNELDEVMENIFLSGEIDINECFDSLDYVLTEAKVTSSDDRPSGSAKVTTSAQRPSRVKSTAQRKQQVRVGRIAQAAKRVGQQLASPARGKSGTSVSTRVGQAGNKIASATQKVKGFLGKVGSAVTAGASAAKKEFSGQSSREARARETGREMRRAARKQAAASKAKDTSEFSGGGSKSNRPPKVTVGKTERAGGTQPSEPSRPVPNAQRIATAKAKLKRQASGTRGGVRFVTPSGQAAPTAMRSGSGSPVERGKKAKAFAKKAGLNDHCEYLLDAIFEDMFIEGYVSDYDTAYSVLESLSEDDLFDILESYDSYLTEEVETLNIFDVVLEHLLDEGYANTEDQAIAIMANMSEQWRDEILEDLRGAITYNPNTPIGKLKRRIKGSTPQKREARTREYQGNKSDSAERFGGSQRAPYDDNRGDIPALRNR